jgi:ribosomal protein L16 Arg81 hydroxylase
MGTRTPTFAELVGDEDEFFADYYAKRPLLRRGALAGDVTQVLSIADMDDIVHSEGLRPSLIRMLGQGTGAAGPSLTRRLDLRREGKVFDDALAADKIYAHFRAGKTLINGGLNHTHANIRALCAVLTDKFAAPSEAVAFLTPAGKQAGGAHSDPSDVYVIQLEGTKHWKVWPTPPARRYGVDLEFELSELGEPVLDFSLRPGDVLYVPYGTPHMAVAQEQVSLHLTVVSLSPTWAQLLLPVVERVLADHDEFWPTPYIGDDPAVLAATMKDLLAALADHLGRAEIAGALDRAVATGRAYEGVRQGHYFQEMAAVDRIGRDTMVAAVPGTATFHGASDGLALVTILGNKLKMPEATASALAAAGGAMPSRAGAFLSDGGADASLASVKQLIRLGALRVVEAG